MKKLQENIIFKTIICLIVTIIMAIIIFFVYQYYDDLAKNNNKKDDKEEVEKENNSDNDLKEDNVKEDIIISFNEFKNKKINIEIEEDVYTLDMENTDAGNILTLDGNALIDAPNNAKVYYLVLDDILILNVLNNSNYSTLFVNTDYKIIKEYSKDYINKVKYNINLPVIDNDYKDSVYVKNNNIYITYVIDNLNDELKDDTIIQYTTMLTYSDGSLVDEDNIVSRYTYKEYKEK